MYIDEPSPYVALLILMEEPSQDTGRVILWWESWESARHRIRRADLMRPDDQGTGHELKNCIVPDTKNPIKGWALELSVSTQGQSGQVFVSSRLLYCYLFASGSRLLSVSVQLVYQQSIWHSFIPDSDNCSSHLWWTHRSDTDPPAPRLIKKSYILQTKRSSRRGLLFDGLTKHLLDREKEIKQPWGLFAQSYWKIKRFLSLGKGARYFLH